MAYRVHDSRHWQDHRPHHSSNLRYTSCAYTPSPSPCPAHQQSSSSRFPSLSHYHGSFCNDSRDTLDHAHNNVHACDHNAHYDHIYATPPPLPPRSSSLHSQHGHNSQHTTTSTMTTVSTVHPLPPLPTTSPLPSLTRSRRKSISSRLATIHTSPITSLTTSQFQHNVFPILQGIASQMYRARVLKEASRWDGEGDVLSVKAPTMGQVLRKAEKVGWNLGWEGWRW